MKHTPSNEAIRQLHDRIISVEGVTIPTHEVLYAMVKTICEWYEQQNTFTDAVTTDGKRCPTCGSLWIISKRYLPKYLMKPLRILSKSPRAMTTKELTKLTGNRQVYTKFAWLVHWQLVEKVGKSLFIITDLGRQFIDGGIRVPDFLWMLKNEVMSTPEGHEHPNRVSCYDLSPTDTDDHAAHVERAAPAAGSSDTTIF